MRLGEHALSGSAVMTERPTNLQSLWADRYGPLIAGQLEPDTRYSIIKVGAAEFAYSDYGSYLRALGQAWDAGFVPDPCPNVIGRELPEAAPNLKGVNADLRELEPADVEPRRGRFEPAG